MGRKKRKLERAKSTSVPLPSIHAVDVLPPPAVLTSKKPKVKKNTWSKLLKYGTAAAGTAAAAAGAYHLYKRSRAGNPIVYPEEGMALEPNDDDDDVIPVSELGSYYSAHDISNFPSVESVAWAPPAQEEYELSEEQQSMRDFLHQDLEPIGNVGNRDWLYDPPPTNDPEGDDFFDSVEYF